MILRQRNKKSNFSDYAGYEDGSDESCSSEISCNESSHSSMADGTESASFLESSSNNGEDHRHRKHGSASSSLYLSKPGLTAKNRVRHFVQHNYHDHANELPNKDEAESKASPKKRSKCHTFPVMLHNMLTEVEAKTEHTHIVSWQPHGRAFIIHRPKEFVEKVLKKYFRQTKLTSFQRQLNLYGFERITRGPDAGAYYHELFLRDRVHLLKHIVRLKVKGTGFKAAANPDSEPRFYEMPYVLPEPETIPAYPFNKQQDVYNPKPPEDPDEVVESVPYNDCKPPTTRSLVSLPLPAISDNTPFDTSWRDYADSIFSD